MAKQSVQKAKRDYYTCLFLYSLWIPYFGFLLYWMTKEDCLIQLGMIAMILPAVFQPLFWYLFLGVLLHTFIAAVTDDGEKKKILSYRPNRRRHY